MDSPFELGDLVWVRRTLKPGKVLPQMWTDSDICEPQQYIYFFGTHDSKWVNEWELIHHSEEMLQKAETLPKDAIHPLALKEMRIEITKLKEEYFSNFKPLSHFMTDDIEEEPDHLGMSLEEPPDKNMPLEESPDAFNDIKEHTFNRDNSYLNDASIYNVPKTLPQDIFSSPSSTEALPQDIFSSPPISKERASVSFLKVPNSTNQLDNENVNQDGFDNTASTSWDYSNVCDSEVFDSLAFLNKSQPSTSLLEDLKSAVVADNVQINANELSNNNCTSTSSNDQSLCEILASPASDIPSDNDSSISVVEKPGKSSQDNSSVQSVEDSGEALLIDPQIGDIDETQNNNSSDIFNGPNNIRSTKKEIGFLGIGEMGSVLVKNLLSSGHFITVWNRSPEKYRDFLIDGAEEAKFPCEVIQRCDITFCCLSDDIAVKKVVEGKNGVIEGFKECKDNKTGKGFVQLTTLDPSISLNHSESISKLGGKYLEAVMMGTKELAQNLLIMYICAGHIGLFEDCYTCFAATSRQAFFF